MAYYSYLKNDWSAGEISPRVSARVELPAYRSGCQIMENMIPLPGGGAIRRPGTYYVGQPKSGLPAKLIPVSKQLAFNSSIAEFTPLHLRLWDASTLTLIRDTAGDVDITTTYTAEHVPQLQGLTIVDKLVVVHNGTDNRSGGSYPPKSLSRSSTQRRGRVYKGTASRLANDANTVLPMIGGDLTNVGIAQGMAVYTDFGREWSIVQSISGTRITVDRVVRTPPFPSSTAGTPSGNVGRVTSKTTVEVYCASTTVSAGKLIDANGDFVTKGVAANDIVYNVKSKSRTKVTSRDSPTQLTLADDIFTSLGDGYTIVNPTYTWANLSTTGARDFATAGNYPSVVFSCQGRLGFGGTLNEPDLVALSRAPAASTGTYRTTDFTLGTAADDAIIVYASDGKNGSVSWAAGHRRLCLGTAYATWQGPAGLAAASSFAMDYIDGQYSAKVPAVSIDKSVFYVSAPRPHLHMLYYSQEGGGMMDVDLSIYSDHILEPGVRALAAMASPFPIVWAVRDDGTLVSCTVDMQGGNVQPGWARHPLTDGATVEDLCVLTDPAGDQLWMVVNRPTVGRTIEFLQVLQEQDDDFTNVHYVDCGVGLHQTAATTVSGLSHLEGCKVDAVADGGSMPPKTVSGGAVTYTSAVSRVHIGLGYVSGIRPTNPELQVNGTWMGKRKRVEEVTLKLLRTLGGKVSMSPTEPYIELPYLVPGTTIMGSAPAPFTGDVKITLGGRVDTEGAPFICQDQPWPFTILSIVSKIGMMEQ